MNEKQDEFLEELAALFEKYKVRDVYVQNDRVMMVRGIYEIGFRKYLNGVFMGCFGALPSYISKQSQ